MYRHLALTVGLASCALAGADRATAPARPAIPAATPEVARGLRFTPDGIARLTGTLPNLNLPDAAARLSALMDLEVVLPEPEEPDLEEGEEDPQAPGASLAPARFDLTQRATLAWKDAPLGEALRQFCRAYGCRLDWGGQPGGSLFLTPGVLPKGPVARVPGFSVEVAAIHYHDERTAEETGIDPEVERGLELQLSVRADSGDPAPIYGFHNVRVVDDQNRDALEAEGEPDGFGLSSAASPSPFPDERVRSVPFAWPYPAPHRLHRIEGDLLLYSRIRRMPLDLRLPKPGEMGEMRKAGPFRIEFQQSTFEAGTAALGLHVNIPPGVTLQPAGQLPRATLILEDGSRVPALLFRTDSGDLGDGSRWHYQTLELEKGGLKTRPVRLQVDMLVKSDPDRKLPFRFTDYPAVITPRGTGQ